MKPLTVAALLLLVVAINAKYEFGDIIAFPRTKKCKCLTVTYKHFAVYVGHESIAGKKPDEDLFHRTGPNKASAGCVFGKLSDEPKHSKSNYLDGKLEVGNHNEILRRITEKKNNCEKYNLCKNNCEHLATYVRYGKKRSEQHNTTFEKWTCLCSQEKRRRRAAAEDGVASATDLEEVSCDELCTCSGGGESGLSLLSLICPLAFVAFLT